MSLILVVNSLVIDFSTEANSTEINHLKLVNHLKVLYTIIIIHV